MLSSIVLITQKTYVILHFHKWVKVTTDIILAVYWLLETKLYWGYLGPRLSSWKLILQPYYFVSLLTHMAPRDTNTFCWTLWYTAQACLPQSKTYYPSCWQDNCQTPLSPLRLPLLEGAALPESMPFVEWPTPGDCSSLRIKAYPSWSHSNNSEGPSHLQNSPQGQLRIPLRLHCNKTSPTSQSCFHPCPSTCIDPKHTP